MSSTLSPLVCYLLFHLAISGVVSINAADNGGCPDGFTYLPAAETCIKLLLKPLEWSQARTECQGYNGAYLTAVNSEEEYNDQVQLLKDSKKELAAAGCGNHVWIGAQTKDKSSCSSPYVWKPNVHIHLPLCYSKWSTARPNCWGGNEHCVGYYVHTAIKTITQYQWNDLRCDKKHCSICELSPFE